MKKLFFLTLIYSLFFICLFSTTSVAALTPWEEYKRKMWCQQEVNTRQRQQKTRVVIIKARLRKKIITKKRTPVVSLLPKKAATAPQAIDGLVNKRIKPTISPPATTRKYTAPQSINRVITKRTKPATSLRATTRKHTIPQSINRVITKRTKPTTSLRATTKKYRIPQSIRKKKSVLENIKAKMGVVDSRIFREILSRLPAMTPHSWKNQFGDFFEVTFYDPPLGKSGKRCRTYFILFKGRDGTELIADQRCF